MREASVIISNARLMQKRNLEAQLCRQFSELARTVSSSMRLIGMSRLTFTLSVKTESQNSG
jgi:hypothetical protein